MKLVLASSNLGKLKEFQALFSAHPEFSVHAQQEFGVLDVPETGLSFVENALIKARHAAAHTQCLAIGDDSGLVVPALGGAPGIYSARYAGAEATSQDRMNKLLQEMKDVPEGSRDAFFVCVLVLLRHATDPMPLICQGVWHGRILRAAQGSGGFGYDPIMYIPQLKCSVAELPGEVKNRLSHRGQAFAQLLGQLGARPEVVIAASHKAPSQ